MAERPSMPVAQLDDRSWHALSDAVRGFEAAWKQSPRPELAAFLPDAGTSSSAGAQSISDALRERILIELIKVDQEHRWRRGERQLLEAYVSQWPQLAQRPEALAELLAAECLTRSLWDVTPNPEEIASRYPTLCTQVDLSRIAAEAQAERGRARCEAAEETSGVSDTLTGTPVRSGRMHAVSGQGTPRGPEDPAHGERLPFASGPPEARVGQRLGRYEIRSLIGYGGMGAVYRAFDPALEREIALKVPQVDATVDPVILERFLREARAAAAVRHPNVCPIYDAGQIGGTHYIAMALVEDQPLGAWIDQHEVSPDEAAEIVRKLALALAKLHDAGILHRDVKASNVMIDESGEPILMDFGLARQTRDQLHLTSSNSLLGTPAYMAPEQVHGGAAAGDARSDIYSLGVVLYQLLTRRLPFTGP